ncbi:MAG: HEAT repeat domain-containing protein, partial [Planctomycetes bacterium]|nr:HEAT repeat domain-containing protein [Planctomycetota bacterium]
SAAVEAMGNIPSPASEDAVKAAISDKDLNVKCQALVALAKLRKGGARNELMEALGNKDNPELCKAAIRGLVHIGTIGPINEMIKALEHPNTEVRLEAARGLGKVKSTIAVGALLNSIVKDGSKEVRREAERALMGYPIKDLSQLKSYFIGANKDLYYPVFKIISAKLDDDWARFFAKSIVSSQEKYATVVRDVLEALVKYNAKEFDNVFTTFSMSEDRIIRIIAIRCLAKSSGGNLFALLAPHFKTKDSGVCAEALKTIRAATEGAPEGGIVNFLSPIFSGGMDRGTVKVALELMRDRITAEEAGAAVELLSSIIEGDDQGGVRSLAVDAITKLHDDAANLSVSEHLGYVDKWAVVGPFINVADAVYAPEHEIDFSKTYTSDLTAGKGLGYGADYKEEECTINGLSKNACNFYFPYQGVNVGRLSMEVKGITVPDDPSARLAGSISVSLDGGVRENVYFAVYIDGESAYSKSLRTSGDGWKGFALVLKEHAGKKIDISIATSSKALADQAAAAFSDLRIVGKDDKVLLDLMPTFKTAKAELKIPEDFDRKATWKKAAISPDKIGRVLLHDIYEPPTNRLLAYAYCILDSDGDKKVKLEYTVEADDSGMLWVNGKKLDLNFQNRWGSGKVATTTADLHKGQNKILLRVGNNEKGWFYKLRVTDYKGAMVKGIRVVPVGPKE